MTKILKCFCIVGVSFACVHAATQSHCYDNTQYSFDHEGKTLTCQQINQDEFKRIDACTIDEIRSNCPQTCGLCCGNDVDFRFETRIRKNKDCTWLGAREVRKYLYCNTENDGRMVKDGCTKACDSCKSYVDNIKIPDYLKALTLPPISPKTLSPTLSPAPTIVNCVDHNNFKYRRNHTCLDLRKDEYRRQKFCKMTKVRQKCPVSCGLCCVDDETYSFVPYDNAKLHTCSTLQLSEIKRLRYCNTRETREACRSTCENCFSRVTPKDYEETSEEEKSDNGNRGRGPGSAINQDIRSDLNQDNTYLIISLTFVGIGLAFSVYGAYINHSKPKPKKKRNDVKAKFFNHDKKDRKLSEEQSTPTSQIVEESFSDRSLTFDIGSSNLSPKQSSTTSFVAATMTDLGKNDVSQSNVHKCTNFPCMICAKEKQITFVKVQRNNIERDEEGRINFVPVPVDFIGDVQTKEIKNLDTLTLSTNTSVEQYSSRTSTSESDSTSALNQSTRSSSLLIENDESVKKNVTKQYP